MPKPAPFILLATFLTHDNNFHLYLSRECEKRALHHRARAPRGCRISRPGELGPHLQGRPGLSGRHCFAARAGQVPIARMVLGGVSGQGQVGNGAALLARCRRLDG